jgi:hypothetical protein
MLGLSFLAPLFLAGAVAVAIPIALHLFHRRAEPVIDFAAMRYLRLAPVEQSRRRRVRELVLLALRVTALALMAFAFARPYFAAASGALAEGATVVLVDTSASVTAPGQFEQVRSRAADVIRQVPVTQAVAVLSFAQTADVIAPLAADRSLALAAVSQLQPGGGATRYRAALRRAGEELAGRSGRVVMVTDLQASGWEAGTEGGVPDNVTVDVEAVAAPPANIALTSLRIEGGDAVARVSNYSADAATEQVAFVVDERRIGAVPLTVPPAGSVEARVPITGVSSGALTATISDTRGYAADNVRYAIVNGDDGIFVLAVSSSGNPADSLYLERALGIAGGAGGFRFRSIAAAGLASVDEATFNGVDVIVLLGSRGLDQRGRQRLGQFAEAGGGILVAAGPDIEPDMLSQGPARVMATSWRSRDAAEMNFAPDDSRHPVFRLFGGAGTLSNVTFTRSALLSAPAGGTVIARYTDGTPAVIEERSGTGRVLLLASDLNYRWNDFPLQPAFVPFVHETIRYLAASRAARMEYVVGELAGQAMTAGIVHVGTRQVAVNVDSRESDPNAMTTEAFRDGISRLRAPAAQETAVADRQREDGQGLWRYGLLLMLLTLVGEGLLGRRLG